MNKIRKYTQAKIENQIEEQGNNPMPIQESLVELIKLQKSLKTIRKFMNIELRNAMVDESIDIGKWNWDFHENEELTNGIKSFNNKLLKILNYQKLNKLVGEEQFEYNIPYYIED